MDLTISSTIVCTIASPSERGLLSGFEQLAALKAQLNQGANGKKVASRLTSRQWTSCGKSSSHRSLRERLLAQPRAQLPRCNDISRAALLGLSERNVRNGVKLWCRGQRYWTCLVEGYARVDLTGAMTGVVTAVEAEYGTSRKMARLARRREQIPRDLPGQPR